MLVRVAFCVAVVVALAGCGPAEVATRQPATLALSAPRFDPAAARDAINAYRARWGLPPLALNSRLTAAARTHAADLARRDTISHRGADGSTPWQRMTAAGYRARLAAENVAVGQADFAAVLRGWQRSAAHDRNLRLADAREMGVALVFAPESRYRTFWVLTLGTAR